MGRAVGRERVHWRRSVAGAVIVVAFFASADVLHAQGLGSLAQLLGGGSQHSRSSSQSGSAVTVERNAAPYMGEFSGRVTTSSGAHSFNSRFACYPAQDPIFAQTETFVCYAAQSPTN
jgi:hypothetical protein